MTWTESDADLEQQAIANGVTSSRPTSNGHRTPPSDDFTEAAVLGAALITTTALQAATDTGLEAHHFYRPRHQHIWSALAATGAADRVLVVAWLRDHQLLDDAGGEATLLQLMADAPGTNRAGEHATRIVHLARLRRIIGAANDLTTAAWTDDTQAIAGAIERLTAHQPTTAETIGSLVDWHTLFDRDITTDWLLEPLIARGRGHALYAGQKAGKSLLIASVLVPAALGHHVLGRPAGPPLRTLYLDFEMTRDDVAERVEAMGFGPEHAEQLEPLAYHVLPSIPPLDTAEGGRTVLAWALGHHADLVVIDTLARGVAGAENDADTYRAYYRHTGQILKAAGITTLRLDHAGKDADKGQRGSSAKADDVDVVWKLVAREQGQFTLQATHRRMGWVPQKVDLMRKEDPLTYIRISGAWPAGTKACAQALDDLDAPIDISRRGAADLLRGVYAAKTEVIGAAVKWRRERGDHPGDHPSETDPDEPGTTEPEPI